MKSELNFCFEQVDQCFSAKMERSFIAPPIFFKWGPFAKFLLCGAKEYVSMIRALTGEETVKYLALVHIALNCSKTLPPFQNV